VTLLISEAERENKWLGTVNGVAFLVASISSGLAIGFLGVYWMLMFAIGLTLLTILHLGIIAIPEKGIIHAEAQTNHIDIRERFGVIPLVPGLFALIFQLFQQLPGWSLHVSDGCLRLITGFGTNLGHFVGTFKFRLYCWWISCCQERLGESPLRTLFLANTIMWIIVIFFTIQASIVLLAIGLFIYLCLIPVVEHQSKLSAVIPLERQGRVFGLPKHRTGSITAHGYDRSDRPPSSFLLCDGCWCEILGSWFGTGTDRGIALLFTVTGAIGLIVTLMAMRSRSYRRLSANYQVLVIYTRLITLSR